MRLPTSAFGASISFCSYTEPLRCLSESFEETESARLKVGVRPEPCIGRVVALRVRGGSGIGSVVLSCSSMNIKIS